eukprot:15365723-Ditylum_brightwellii.AAC.1
MAKNAVKWSLPLATAWYKVQILLLHLGCFKVGATVALKLTKKLANKGVQFDLPLDIRQTQAELKNTQKEVKKIQEDMFVHRTQTMSEIAA